MEPISVEELRPLRTVLAAFAKQTDWGLSELLVWQDEVTKVVMELPHFDFSAPEKSQLLIRLAQCLNPDLEGGGFAYNTLIIYEDILIKKRESAMPLDECVAMISATVFAFFEVASPQLKREVLRLLKSYYVSMGEQLTVCFSGLVGSLLVGLEDESDFLLVEQTSNLLEDLRRINPPAFYTALWSSLFRMPRMKATALSYLSTLLKSSQSFPVSSLFPDNQALELVITALKSALQDPDSLIKSKSLALIKTLFPFFDPGIPRIAFNKLLSEALISIKDKEFAVNKRVWDWMTLGDIKDVSDLLDIITPPLLAFFEKPGLDEETEDGILAPFLIMEPLFDQPEIAENLFESFCLTLLKHAQKYEEKASELRNRLKTLFSANKNWPKVLWGQLIPLLEDHILTFDLENALKLVKFMLGLERDEAEFGEEFSNVLIIFLESMDTYPKENRLKVYSLGIQILQKLKTCPKVEIQPSAAQFETFLETEMNESEFLYEELDLALSFFAEIHSYEAFPPADTWTWQFLDVIQSGEDNKKTLTACDWILRFHDSSPDVWKLLEDGNSPSELRERELSRLWELLSVDQLSSDIAAMIIRYFLLFRDEMEVTLCAWLLDKDDEIRCQNLTKFSLVWAAGATSNNVETLFTLFGTGLGVYQALESLMNDNPVVRMYAKEWLLETLPRVEVVLKSIFALIQSGEEDQQRAVRFLSAIEANSSEEFLIRIRSGAESPSLFAQLLDQLFGILQKESQSMNPDASSLRQDGCRVLKQIIACDRADVSYEICPRLLQTLKAVISTSDFVIQSELLESFLRIIFKSQLSNEPKLLKDLIQSHVCLLIIEQCTELRSSQWLHSLPDVVKIVVSLVDSSLAASLLKKLALKLIKIAIDDETGTDSFVLGSVLEVILGLANPKIFIQTGGQHLSYLYDDLKNCSTHPNTKELFRTLAKGEATLNKAHPSFVLLQLGFEQLGAVIKAFLPHLPAVGEHIPANFHPILNVVEHFAIQFPNEITAIFINLWISLEAQVAPEMPEAENLHPRLITIYLALKLSWTDVLSGFDRYLREGQDMKRGGKRGLEKKEELLACDFLFKVGEKNGESPDSVEVWELILRLSEVLSYSPHPEVPLWSMQILVQADNMVAYAVRNSINKRLIRDIQQRVSSLVQASLQSSNSEKEVVLCPPCCQDLGSNSLSFQKCALFTLKCCVAPLVKLGWRSEYEQVEQLKLWIQPLITTLLKPKVTQFDHMLIDLLISVIAGPVSIPAFALLINKDFIDFLVTDEFWSKMKDSRANFESWRTLLNHLAINCFPNREIFIQEIMKKLNIGIFSSKNYETQQRVRIIRCIALLIYSGNDDDYQKANSILTEKIIEWLKYGEGFLVPVLFLLCRVLMLKMAPPSVADEWPRLWPHLFIELNRLLSGPYAVQQQLAALKLLELLKLKTDIEDFHFYDWSFFFTSQSLFYKQGKEEPPYLPAIAKLVRDSSEILAVEFPELERSRKHGVSVRSMTVQSLDNLQSKLSSLLTNALYDEVQDEEPDLQSLNQVLEADILDLEVV